MTDENINVPVTSKEQEDALRKEREIKLWKSMQPHERLQAFDKKLNDNPYASSLMKLSFPTVKAIKNVDGFIVVVIEECKALERALKIAKESLPPDTSDADVYKYAKEHAVKTAALTPKLFKNNLRYIMEYTSQSPFYMALGLNKKDELKDLFSDALAALREALEYRRHHPDDFALDSINSIDKRFADGECAVTATNFALLFGNDWKSKLGSDLVEILDTDITKDTDSLILH